MSYFEKKLNHKTKSAGSSRMYSRMLIRVLIILLLVVGVVKGWSCVTDALHNAPVEEWKLNHYRNAQIKMLLNMKEAGRLTDSQFTERAHYWANDSNATREYIADER
jgi:hypothetical protein